ncbi:MAG: LamG-like jellyroll fold domain-containing protein [Pseudomonadota bacterium]
MLQQLNTAGALEGLEPVITTEETAGIPSVGTGLLGVAWADGTALNTISDLKDLIEATPPTATFEIAEFGFQSRQSDTSIEAFLGDKGMILSGDGSAEMGPSGLWMEGYVYIPPGQHTISVVSDDGFELSLGGIPFSSFEGRRGAEETAQTATFEGGLYALEMLYFDASRGMALDLLIDGLPADQSAFYASVEDFENPPGGVPLLPVEGYHPSLTLGELIIDDPQDLSGSDQADAIDGVGGDDNITGAGGDDHLLGGYGDDRIEGGAGDDVLDGGYGSDLLLGGDGNDLLISRSDGGEQRIAQRYVIDETRPAGEYVNPEADKLFGYEYQPLIGDDIMLGGAGRDTFLIAPQLNGRLEILEKHTQSDGSIRWASVAGENTYQHDHWVDLYGFDLIGDYNADEDHIAVIGHTANVFVDHVDYDDDGVMESIITTVSLQHGGGGAHDRDLIGVTFVEGDLVDVDDIKTDNGVTYGVVEGFDDVAQAINQQGESKALTEGGETFDGYDYRGAGEFNVAPVGAAEDLMDTPFWDEAQASFSAPSDEPEVELTRDPFEPLGFEEAAGQVKTGTDGDDVITPDAPAEPDGLPGALGFWNLGAGDQGSYGDARGELAAVKSYTLYERQALLLTDDTEAGPRPGTSALTFNGDDEFAYLDHQNAFIISQGTIALWARADDLSDRGAIVTKDQKSSGDGGHFRLVQLEGGNLQLRFAPGDGGSNVAWNTTAAVLEEGIWAHLAVNFTADGVTVFKDGEAISDGLWEPDEGDVPTPGVYQEAYLLRNEEPFILGADQRITELNDTAQEFATDRTNLVNPFEGALAEFGIWGGFSPDDALTEAELATLISDGPGAALTNPSGPQAMIASDDTFDGGDGDDEIDGEGGNDHLMGGDGDDTIDAGYGDDKLEGGAGDDVLNGGRGSDLVLGGDGNDVMISGGDVGEDRAGQLVLGEPSRPYPDPSIDPVLLKLVDWVDQPLYADDIFFGGSGADQMVVNTYINGKMDAILDNVMDGGRMIHWHGVAGENNRIHDHWVDGIGIDIFGDFDADEDEISVIGHTTEIEISYDTVDTDGDGADDAILSLIWLYSQQGNGGGAHDEDELGILAVIGDQVTEDMVTTDAGAHLGIVRTIDDLQEALAPSDTPSPVTRPGDVFGYDDRDVEGRPLTSDPFAYSVNPFMDEAEALFAWQTAASGENAVIASHPGGTFDGSNSIEIPHDPDEQQAAGTYLLSFTANAPGDGNQALLSKDFTSFEEGGHLTIWVDDSSNLKVRFQSTDSEKTLRMSEDIEAGQTYDIAFSYAGDAIALYVNGVLEDSESGFDAGMLGNENSTFLGASTRKRKEDADNLEWFFEGEIAKVAVLDEDISATEALLLAQNGNDPSIFGDAGEDPAPDPDVGEEDDADEGTDPAPDPDAGGGEGADEALDEDDASDAEAVRLELGFTQVEQLDRDTWHSVTFDEEIADAVVVMGPLEGTGSHDATVHVRNVTSTGFEFQINEWSNHNGRHQSEGVSWMAISEGTHRLASGETISAGSLQSNAELNTAMVVALDGFDAAPSVFSQVTSANESGAVATRHVDVTADTFAVLLQEEEAAPDQVRAEESIDWIAFSDDISDILDIASVEGGLRHRYTSVEFDPFEGDVVLLAAMQTMNGGDTANLRYRNLDNDSVRLKVAEERSADRERTHVTEEVDVLVGVVGSYDLELA